MDSSLACERDGEGRANDSQQIRQGGSSAGVASLSSDVDGKVSSDVKLVGEGFLEEKLFESRAEEGGVESEEGSDGVVDLVVLGRERARSWSAQNVKREDLQVLTSST